MLQWYVAKVKPRSERRLQSYLSQYQVAVHVPEITVLNRGQKLMEPLFPGYAFLKLPPSFQDWPLVRWAWGLSYFLPNRKQPMTVPDSLLEEIQARVERWNGGGWLAAFEPGDRVLIVSGPLRTLEAIFQQYIPSRQRCEVLITLLGQLQSVQIPVTDLHSYAARHRFAA